MTGDSSASPDDDTPARSPADADGGTDPGFDEAALYEVVHAATKDAMLYVLGTVLLVGVAFALVAAGGQAILSSDTPFGIVAGLGVSSVGLYIAATSLELVPPIREWL